MMKKQVKKKTGPKTAPRSRTSKGSLRAAVGNKGNTQAGKARRDWTIPFLKQLARSPNVSAACEVASIGRKTAYQERKLVYLDGTPKVGADLEYALAFGEEWDDIIAASIETLEASVRERAEKGSPRKKFTRTGDPIIDPETKEQYIEYERSDMLAALLLKAHKPEIYGDRSRTENFNLDLSTLNEKQLELVRDGASLPTILAAASAGGDGTPSASAE